MIADGQISRLYPPAHPSGTVTHFLWPISPEVDAVFSRSDDRGYWSVGNPVRGWRPCAGSAVPG